MLKVVEKADGSTATKVLIKSAESIKLPPGCSLSLVTTLRSVAHLKQDWRALEDECDIQPTIFQSYDWVQSWCEIYAQPDSKREIQFVIGRRANRVVFIWPLMRERQHGVSVLKWASHPIGQYGDLLVAAFEDTAEWISAATQYLKVNRSADILHLRHVRKTSNFAPYAQLHWNDGRLFEQAPAMDLTQFKSDEDYSARYDAQQRKRRKKTFRKLEELGQLTTKIATENEAPAALALAVSEKLKWLETRGRFNQVLSCSRHNELLEKLIANPDAKMRVKILQISLGDQPSAWEIGFEWNGIHYGYLTSHLDGLTDLGVGRLTLDIAQRQALKSGLREYDLMVPYDQHKESFSSHKEPVNDWFLPLSSKGSLYGTFYLRLTRPTLREIYRRLPPPVLRVLKRLLGQ